MLNVQAQRRRLEIGRAGTRCGLCGSENVVIVESRAIRRGLHLLNPAFRGHPRRYELCRDCGAKHGED
jgi:hypothetical protein